MNRASTYDIYGVAADKKTQDVLALAAQKGIKMNLKDLREDPKANSDFLGRGHSRIPIVFLVGKPAFTYAGDYNQVVELLNALPDEPLPEVAAPVAAPQVEPVAETPTVSDSTDANPTEIHQEAIVPPSVEADAEVEALAATIEPAPEPEATQPAVAEDQPA